MYLSQPGFRPLPSKWMPSLSKLNLWPLRPTAQHRNMIDTLRDLCFAVERPEDTAPRIIFSVPPFPSRSSIHICLSFTDASSAVKKSHSRAAKDTNLVDYLASSDGKPQSVRTRSPHRHAATAVGYANRSSKKGFATYDGLISRTECLLRYMAAVGMVEEIAADSLGPSNITRALTIPGIRAGIGFG
jgi:hypothetical protein